MYRDGKEIPKQVRKDKRRCSEGQSGRSKGQTWAFGRTKVAFGMTEYARPEIKSTIRPAVAKALEASTIINCLQEPHQREA